jgi:hypothetical protein
MDNKASPPSTNTSKKYRDLFPYFPRLEGRLAGEHAVTGVAYNKAHEALLAHFKSE